MCNYMYIVTRRGNDDVMITLDTSSNGIYIH